MLVMSVLMLGGQVKALDMAQPTTMILQLPNTLDTVATAITVAFTTFLHINKVLSLHGM